MFLWAVSNSCWMNEYASRIFLIFPLSLFTILESFIHAIHFIHCYVVVYYKMDESKKNIFDDRMEKSEKKTTFPLSFFCCCYCCFQWISDEEEEEVKREEKLIFIFLCCHSNIVKIYLHFMDSIMTPSDIERVVRRVRVRRPLSIKDEGEAENLLFWPCFNSKSNRVATQRRWKKQTTTTTDDLHKFSVNYIFWRWKIISSEWVNPWNGRMMKRKKAQQIFLIVHSISITSFNLLPQQISSSHFLIELSKLCRVRMSVLKISKKNELVIFHHVYLFIQSLWKREQEKDV